MVLSVSTSPEKFPHVMRARHIETNHCTRTVKQKLTCEYVVQVIYLETCGEHDLVVLDPRWLGMDVIGQLLTRDAILSARPTGCFTVDDFQLIFPDAEAKDILQVRVCMWVCVSECVSVPDRQECVCVCVGKSKTGAEG